MTLGPIAFGLIVWGAIALVFCVFVYELRSVSRDRHRDGQSCRERASSLLERWNL